MSTPPDPELTDINGMTAFGVVATPALVVDGEIKVVGRVPTDDTITLILAWPSA